jgi:hypothetical protein
MAFFHLGAMVDDRTPEQPFLHPKLSPTHTYINDRLA